MRDSPSRPKVTQSARASAMPIDRACGRSSGRSVRAGAARCLRSATAKAAADLAQHGSLLCAGQADRGQGCRRQGGSVRGRTPSQAASVPCPPRASRMCRWRCRRVRRRREPDADAVEAGHRSDPHQEGSGRPRHRSPPRSAIRSPASSPNGSSCAATTTARPSSATRPSSAPIRAGPSLTFLRRRGEAALWDDKRDDATVLNWFGNEEPVSGQRPPGAGARAAEPRRPPQCRAASFARPGAATRSPATLKPRRSTSSAHC